MFFGILGQSGLRQKDRIQKKSSCLAEEPKTEILQLEVKSVVMEDQQLESIKIMSGSLAVVWQS